MVGNLDALDELIHWLQTRGIGCWIFGGWAHELRGLSPPRAHKDVDLLYPAESFDAIDRLIENEQVTEIGPSTSCTSARSCAPTRWSRSSLRAPTTQARTRCSLPAAGSNGLRTRSPIAMVGVSQARPHLSATAAPMPS
jgi:Aminoglycoside-2''-adenylyltransferase